MGGVISLSLEFNMTEDKDYADNIMAKLMTPGQWIQFPMIFLQSFTGTESIMLAFLINYRSHFAERKDFDGWFYCRAKRIEDRLSMSKRSQARIFAILKEKGVIETQYKGPAPGRRHFLIRFDKIEELLVESIKNGAR